MLSNIKGFLFDLDGTLYMGDSPIDGAVACIKYLKNKNIPCRFLTNTTTKSHESMYEKLIKLELPIEKDEIIFPTIAAVAYLRKRVKQGDHITCHFLLTDDPKQDFSEFRENSINPDFVVIGDFAKQDWNYDVMNDAFRMILGGAKLLALHKGRFWQMPDGLRMDIGAFVAGLEYVTSQEALVFGKPSVQFFNMALEHIGLEPAEVAMIGDDIINDVGGAQGAGCMGIMVKTGKYRKELVAKSEIKPDLVIDSVEALTSLI